MFILDILTFDFEVGFLMNHEVDLINLFCVLSENFVFLGEFGVKKFAYLGIFVFWKVRVENQVLGVICKENEYVEGGFVLEKSWNSISTNTKAKIGPNNGNKLNNEDKIFLKKNNIENFKTDI